LGSIPENEGAIERVRATIDDKSAFFAGDNAASVVSNLDEAVSNFLLAIFKGMPAEEKKRGEYKKIERQLKLATAAFKEPERSAILPLLYVANVLNSDERSLHVRADFLNINTTGKSSPQQMDVFLDFANSNPVGHPFFLPRLQESCAAISEFHKVLYTDGAAAQWFQVTSTVKTKLEQCRTAVPSIAGQLTGLLADVDAVSAQLYAVMKDSIRAAGSISSRFAKTGEDRENNLLQQAIKVAENKLQQDAPENKVFQGNELLDDGFLRNVLIQFCQKLSQHVPEIGTFHTR
jgi:hypothetical protein